MTESVTLLDLDPSLNVAPDHIKTIHIIGICGTGMAALAGMLKEEGYIITGSDSHVYPPMSDFLNQLKIKVFDGYSSVNLQSKPDLVIVGNVAKKSNPEAQELAKTGLPYLSFPQALAHFFISTRRSLVVAGTHGKTTTSSLLASTLFAANQDPSFMIGGMVRQFDGNFRVGKGPHFISEGDEYDTAFFDKESKFLHYLPEVAIITSIEFDHADIFTDLDQIIRAFSKFVSLLPPHGLIVANLDDENVKRVVSQASCPVVGYGLKASHYWQLKNISIKDGQTSFSVSKKGVYFGTFSVRQPGKHNALNALAVIAVLDHLGLAPASYQKGLAEFGGVKRRQEVRGIINNITVIDDFAHHPTAVKVTLNGLKLGYANSRLIAVFEPRTNSSRRAIFQQDYTRVFDDADMVLIREPVPLDNVPTDEMFSSAKLAEELRLKGLESQSFKNADEILSYLEQVMEPGDVVAILSNGGFENIHAKLLQQLENTNRNGKSL